MATSNNGFFHADQPGPPPSAILPPWMVGCSSTSPVTLTLSSLMGLPDRPTPWLGIVNNNPHVGENNNMIFSELVECCRELDEGHRAWAAHRKESSWRLKRVDLQLESEKAFRRREKMEEIEAKVKALMDKEKATLDWMEGEYREHLAGLIREAEVKDQKLAEQWRLSKFLDQMSETNGR